MISECLQQDQCDRLLGGVPLAEMALNDLFSLRWFFGEAYANHSFELTPLSFG